MQKILDKIELTKFKKLEGLCRIEPENVINFGLELLAKYGGKYEKEELAPIYKCIGFSYCFIWQFEEAIKNSLIALSGYSNKSQNKQVADCYFNIGTIYFYAGDYSIALVNYNKALNIYKSVKNDKGLANAYNGIGSVYCEVHQNENSIKHLDKAFQIAEKISEKTLLARISTGIAVASLNIKEYDKVIQYAERGLKIFQEKSNHFDIALSSKVLGASYFGKGNEKESLKYYNTSLKLLEKLGNEKEVLSTKLKIAEIYLKQGKVDDVAKILIACDPIIQEKKYYELEKDLLHIRINLSRRKKEKGIEALFERLTLAQEKIIEQHSKNNGELIDLSDSVSNYENVELKKKAEQLQNANESLKTLTQIGEEIASVSNIEELIEKIYEKLNLMLDASVLAISIYDEESDELLLPQTIEKGEKLGSARISLKEDERLAVICFKESKEIIINNYENYTDISQTTYIGEMPESVIYFPLKFNEKTIGTISVQSFKKQAYPPSKVEILRNLSNYISIAIENAFLLNNLEEKVSLRTEEIEKSYEDLQSLSKIGKQITSSLNAEEIVNRSFDFVSNLMKVETFGIGFLNDDKTGLDMYIREKDEIFSYTIDLADEKLATICFNNKQEILLNESSDHHKYISQDEYELPAGDPTESVIYSPVIHNEEYVGVITVQSFHKNAFHKQHVNILKNLANYASVAMDNAKAFENLRALGQIGKEVTSTLSLESVLEILYKNLVKLMDTYSFMIGTFDKQKNELTYEYVIENEERMLLGIKKPIEHERSSLSNWCYHNKKSIFIGDAEQEYDDYVDAQYLVVGKSPSSLIFIPLIIEDEVLGLISVQSLKKNAYSQQHLEILKSLATYASVALNNTLSFRRQREIGEIGQEITSMNSISEINHLVYKKLQQVMALNGFGVAVYNEINNSLDWNSYIENGEELEFHSNQLTDDRYATYCFNNQEILHFNNSDEGEKYVTGGSVALAGDDTQSIVYVPLMKKNKCLGVITVQAFEKDIFSEQSVNLVQNLAPYVAVAIENATSLKNLTQLSLIGKEITSILNVPKVIDILHDRLSSFLDTTVLFIGLHDESEKILTIVKAYEEGEVIIVNKNIEIIGEENASSICITQKKEVITRTEEEFVNLFPSYLKDKNKSGKLPHSLIYLPLIYEDNVLGVLSVQSFVPNAYSEEHLEILRNVASYVTVTINNIKSYEALESAKAEMEKLSIVASETDNAIIIANNKGEIEWVNEAYTEMTGYNLQELFDDNKTTIQSMSSFEGISEKVFEVLKKKVSVNYEGVFTDKLGNRRFVQTNLTPIFDEQGEVKKLIAIDADITSQKLAEIEIREQNRNITDSINYAKRIQDAILPSTGFIESSLPNSFIYFKPRDIVSGDFYWLTKTKNDEIIVAAVDCTGHGVPGAFLTIVGNNLLNQIVNIEEETSPGKILEKMNLRLLDRFSTNDETQINDGMDISICKLKNVGDKVDVTYSGAFNAMYYTIENELHELKANRFAIGTPIENDRLIFEEHSLQLDKNNMIYLFSDGFSDQLGGLKGKKFMKKRFKEFLINISESSLNDQKDKLNSKFKEWSGNIQQLDDVLVIGIKV